MAIMKQSTPRHELFKYSFDVYSRLSLNGHLYTTDTSVKRTLRVGPCLSLLPLLILTLYKMDTSLRRTLSAGPKGVRLRESGLYSWRENVEKPQTLIFIFSSPFFYFSSTL